MTLKFWNFRQVHKSQSRGMLPSTSFMVLNSTAITRYYPQPNNSFLPLALIAHLSCWQCWLERPYFILCMKETSWADTTSLYLLPNARQRNAGSLQWECSCRAVCKPHPKQNPRACLEMQRFWVWMVDTSRKKGWMVWTVMEEGCVQRIIWEKLCVY